MKKHNNTLNNDKMGVSTVDHIFKWDVRENMKHSLPLAYAGAVLALRHFASLNLPGRMIYII